MWGKHWPKKIQENMKKRNLICEHRQLLSSSFSKGEKLISSRRGDRVEKYRVRRDSIFPCSGEITQQRGVKRQE